MSELNGKSQVSVLTEDRLRTLVEEDVLERKPHQPLEHWHPIHPLVLRRYGFADVLVREFEHLS